jgi:hypothetical protein
MARPRFRPTKDQRKLVQSLAAIGVRQEHISAAIGIRSPKTLRKHFSKDIAKGDAEATATVMATAYSMATSGNFPGVTRFWLSTVGGGPGPGPVNDDEQDDRDRDEGRDSDDDEDPISTD